MNALLLSAGLGTRFRPTTDKIPKPAIPFLNIPLLGYSLFYVEELGLSNLVLNTHHLPDAVRTVAGALTAGQRYEVHFSHEPKILGSGGGIRQAEKFFRWKTAKEQREGFVVSNADEVLVFNHDRGLKPLWEYHHQQDALVTLLTTDHPEAGRTLGGVWVGANGAITRLGGTHSEPGAKHFTGVYIFSPRVFSYMPESGEFHIFKDCLHKAMAAGEKVLAFHDSKLTWYDMSSEADHKAATEKALMLLKADSPSMYAKNLRRVFTRYRVN